jgi:hypothetical protein
MYVCMYAEVVQLDREGHQPPHRAAGGHPGEQHLHPGHIRVRRLREKFLRAALHQLRKRGTVCIHVCMYDHCMYASMYVCLYVH